MISTYVEDSLEASMHSSPYHIPIVSHFFAIVQIQSPSACTRQLRAGSDDRTLEDAISVE